MSFTTFIQEQYKKRSSDKSDVGYFIVLVFSGMALASGLMLGLFWLIDNVSWFAPLINIGGGSALLIFVLWYILHVKDPYYKKQKSKLDKRYRI